MRELAGRIPDPEAVLTLSVEELARTLLFLIKQRFAAGQAGGLSHAGVHLPNMVDDLGAATGREPAYGHRTEGVQLAVAEALAWLDAQVLLVPSPGSNGTNGWRVLSRRAQAMTDESDFDQYRSARLLPRELLHPAIADQVWGSFVRGEYDTAAFQAMRQVEIATREPSGINKLGVKLAREAFKPLDPNTGDVGPLTEPDLDPGEQQGTMDLFAGALGALKNPHSHRVVLFESPADAAAVVIFASQLLRMIDNRGVAPEEIRLIGDDLVATASRQTAV